MSNIDDLEGADIWGDSQGNENNDQNNNENDEKNTGGSSSTDANNNSDNNGNSNENNQQQAQEEDDPHTRDTMDDDETQSMSISDLRQRVHLLDNDIRVMKSDCQRISHESRAQKERIRENQEKVKVNKQLPYLVGNVVEVLEPEAEDGESSKNEKKDHNDEYQRPSVGPSVFYCVDSSVEYV